LEILPNLELSLWKIAWLNENRN